MSTTLLPESAFVIIIQKTVLDAILILILNDRTQIDIMHALKYIPLHIRIDRFKLCDELLRLHAL